MPRTFVDGLLSTKLLPSDVVDVVPTSLVYYSRVHSLVEGHLGFTPLVDHSVDRVRLQHLLLHCACSKRARGEVALADVAVGAVVLTVGVLLYQTTIRCLCNCNLPECITQFANILSKYT